MSNGNNINKCDVNVANAINCVTLNNGIMMPMVGMGTYPLSGFNLAMLLRKAVQLGYRSFDLASAYGNESWFGRGIKICGQHRNNLFITTKLSPAEQRGGDVRHAFQNSLKRLGTKYLNLYLMHFPIPDIYLSSWKQMEALYKDGLVRAIGVCNFHEHHLKKLLDIANIVPAVNQVELHPLLSQCDLVRFCKKAGIQVEAYSPLARMHDRLIKSEVLMAIAGRHQKTVPQIILRWDYQRGIISIPKSSNLARLRDNISIFNFTLSDKEMGLIDSLNINFRVRYDPDNFDF